MKQSLQLRIGQSLTMTPQLQQAIKLLQLSRLELGETLTQEILENPILDVDFQTVEPETGGVDQTSTVAAILETKTTDRLFTRVCLLRTEPRRHQCATRTAQNPHRYVP